MLLLVVGIVVVVVLLSLLHHPRLSCVGNESFEFGRGENILLCDAEHRTRSGGVLRGRMVVLCLWDMCAIVGIAVRVAIIIR